MYIKLEVGLKLVFWGLSLKISWVQYGTNKLCTKFQVKILNFDLIPHSVPDIDPDQWILGFLAESMDPGHMMFFLLNSWQDQTPAKSNSINLFWLNPKSTGGGHFYPPCHFFHSGCHQGDFLRQWAYCKLSLGHKLSFEPLVGLIG